MYNDLLSDIKKDIYGNWEDIKIIKNEEKMNRFYNDIHHILDRIIELNIENRKRIGEDIKDIIGLDSYLEEYCTIRFDCGRQIGKTEWICKRITDRDVVIVMNNRMKKIFIERGVNKNNIIIFSNAIRNFYYDKQYKKIYVDEASFNEINLKTLYINFGSNEVEQTFVLLG